jgi:hypothetical protein
MAKEEDYFADQSADEIAKRIESLPPHLMKIFQEKIMAGLKPRHALFIATSYSWRKTEP